MSRSKFDQLWKSGQAPQPHVTRVARNNRPRYQRWLAWHIDLWNEMGQPSELAAFTKRVRAEQERRR